MKEPWNLKKDDERKAETLTTFIIFCEDEVSEPIYFKFFETNIIKVNFFNNQKSKIDNVVKAITHCINEEMMTFKNGSYVLNSDDLQVWCVFDRDIELIQENQASGNVSFDTAINTATQAGIKVAWSNDAFELWILLHFEDVDPSDPEIKNRVEYYNHLTSIFKSIPEPNDDLKKALAHPGFGYKRDLKSCNNFRNIVRGELIPNTFIAIERAKKLESSFQPLIPNYLKVPCTMVHYLVEELIHSGGKIQNN